MNQKYIGVIVLIFGIALASFVHSAKQREEQYISDIVAETGSCYLSDGTCLHEDRDFTIYIVGWAISGALILFGLYLAFIDKTQEVLTEHQVRVTQALESAKKYEKEKDEFNAFLAGFDGDRQRVLKAVKEQEGILQSTLRFRTNLSKTSLSLLLKELEDSKIISRKPAGKTKKVYLVKKF